MGQLDSKLVGQCGKRADIRCDNAGPGPWGPCGNEPVFGNMGEELCDDGVF